MRRLLAALRQSGPQEQRERHKGGDLIALALLLVVALFLVELPRPLLDILLATNLLVSLTLMLRGLFADKSLRLYSFPTILVLTTLFRLALNVSSTKLILLNGDQGLDAAGEVIRSFGMFVVRGDFVVGAIVFIIIAIVNFVVIAKGSARVAEVSARFHLDALPGRQLSIDSEMRAGNISAAEAQRRRNELNKESQFFGSMDGAMKWVQGDAIAGLAITFINAVGGISLGVGRGMEFADAVSTFGVLTIGDGLVSILPSLLISVAAAIVVTHAGGEDRASSGEEIFAQFFTDRRAPIIASGALLGVGLLGLVGLFDFPFIPFFVVSAATALLVAYQQKHGAMTAQVETLNAVAEPLGSGRRIERSMPALLSWKDDNEEDGGLHELILEVDPRMLGPYLGAAGSAGAENEVTAGQQNRTEFKLLAQGMRERLYREKGFVLPKVNLSLSQELGPGGYRVLVREQQIRSGTIRGGAVFVTSSPSSLAVFGIRGAIAARHPIDRRASAWIDLRQGGADALRHLGIEIHNVAGYLILEAVGAALEVVDELFGLDEARLMLEPLERRHKQLVDAVFATELLSYPEFAEVLRRLVRERVSIRDQKLILEGIAEFAALNSDIEDRQVWLAELHSFLRVVLSRGIINDSLGPGDRLRTFLLSSEVEDEFRSAVSLWDNSRNKPPLDPNFESDLKASAAKMFNPVLERGAVPVVVLCAGDIRPLVQDFFGRRFSGADWIRTIAFQELAGQSRPEAIGVLNVGR